jgi:hypothetical protein
MRRTTLILDDCRLMDLKRLADFSDVVGQWTPDPAFDEILAGQRRIDCAKRK